MKILEPIQMIGEYAKTAEEKIIPILDLKALGKKHFHLIVKPPSSDKISYYVGEIDDIPQCNTYNLANVLSFVKGGLEAPRTRYSYLPLRRGGDSHKVQGLRD